VRPAHRSELGVEFVCHDANLKYGPLVSDGIGDGRGTDLRRQDCEFLLVFDDGDFSENETFLVTDWFQTTTAAAHVAVRRHIGAVATLSLRTWASIPCRATIGWEGILSTAQQSEELT
jgi:hypothetical protein